MWADEEQRLVRYLLGQGPPELAAEIEERVVADDDAREELLATADDLIHEYLSGGLSREDRERFEIHFLALPRHRRRVAYMSDLLKAVERVSIDSTEKDWFSLPRPFHRSWTSWAAAAVAVVVAVVGGLFWLVPRPARETVRWITRNPQTPPSTTPVPEEIRTPPTTTRGREGNAIRVVRLPRQPGSPVTVALARGTRAVRLEVAVDDEHPSFDVVLRRADGTDAWRAEGLAPSALGEPLVAEVPAGVLASGEYALRVQGEALRGEPTAQVREHSLRVIRER
jgi:hypothetical protein